MDNSNLLIDFSSPAQKLDRKPLIPVPPQTSLVSKEILEPVADPFEVPEIGAPDPFENVLKCAINSEQSAEDFPQLSATNKREEVDNQIQSDNSNNKKSFKLENSMENMKIVSSSSNDNVLEKIPLYHNKESSCNEPPKDCKNYSQNPLTTLINNSASDTMKNLSKCSDAPENKNQSQFSADFSTEESLKAIIAKRVNRCIRETLNGSLIANKNVNSSVFNKPQNKRSLSFIGLSNVSVKKECERLNKSCTDVKDTVTVENQELNVSSDTSGVELLSPNSTDASADGSAEDQVFKEARKLSRTFSKLAESFRQGQESESDDEDLLSCKPRWLYTDSSEDEQEKLLKDPALNFRRRSNSSSFSMPAPPPHNVLDSPALLAYKSQRSFTQLQVSHNDTQEELKMKRSISLVSHRKEVPGIPPHVVSVPINLMKTDDHPIKLRKKNSGDMKKGPLRAVMPIHSMTKEPIPTGGKLPSKPDTSPELRILKTAYGLGTPNKDNSQLNITPMASSTPNKAESFQSSGNNSLLKPVAPVVANKRRSLESNIGSHKSRGATPEGGAKARSNSANSSIPRVMSVKPQPLRGLPLAPKSASNLPRAAVIQANPHVANVPEKKNALKFKSSINARVLSEVKTKSPKQSKVKTAVNTISSLVRGKKTAGRDKENRVPV